MYKRSYKGGVFNIRFLEGVEEYAICKFEIRCPCKLCDNRRVGLLEVVRDHLLKKEFVKN